MSVAEYEMLCRITQAEAGGEDVKGQKLVTNVILNRVYNKDFPNTVEEVIFQANQFEPVRNGAYDKAVVAESTGHAVMAALIGLDESLGALYFRTVKGAVPECWHERALTKLFDHGGHRFYK